LQESLPLHVKIDDTKKAEEEEPKKDGI